MPDGYSYKIEQCDVPVERRPALERFRAKRRVWISWLDTDDPHAIWSTLHLMVWANVAFKTLTGFAVDNEENALNNFLMVEALRYGHVTTQVLGIRRLMDRGSNIISLRRLVRDVSGCFELFTRENFVCFDGLPYDYQAVLNARFAENVGSIWEPTKVQRLARPPKWRTWSSTGSRALTLQSETAKTASPAVSSRLSRNGWWTATPTIWRNGATFILRTQVPPHRGRKLII